MQLLSLSYPSRWNRLSPAPAAPIPKFLSGNAAVLEQPGRPGCRCCWCQGPAPLLQGGDGTFQARRDAMRGGASAALPNCPGGSVAGMPEWHRSPGRDGSCTERSGEGVCRPSASRRAPAPERRGPSRPERSRAVPSGPEQFRAEPRAALWAGSQRPLWAAGSAGPRLGWAGAESRGLPALNSASKPAAASGVRLHFRLSSREW